MKLDSQQVLKTAISFHIKKLLLIKINITYTWFQNMRNKEMYMGKSKTIKVTIFIIQKITLTLMKMNFGDA